MAIDPKLVDQLLAGYKKPEDMIGESCLLKQLTKALLERAMQAELTGHLGYEKHDPAGRGSGNSRNGKSRKKLKGDFGEMELETPRDRKGTFEPKIVAPHQTRWTGFDDKILSMYSRGMSTREIQGHLEEIYGVEVSPALVSEVTSAVQEEVTAWQHRPLEQRYPIVYMDALYVKMRDNGHVRNRAVYVAIGVNMEGAKEVLGLWSSDHEGAKLWLQVVTELRNRGVEDIFIACVDGLKGFPEAIELVYPKAQVQLCIVHMVRHSLTGPLYGGLSAELRVLETTAGSGCRPAQHLYGRDGGGCGSSTGRIRGEVGSEPSDDQSGVAAELGADHAVLRLPCRDPQGDLHDQRGRVAEHESAQDHQDAGLVSERGSRVAAALAGVAQSFEEVELRAELA